MLCSICTCTILSNTHLLSVTCTSSACVTFLVQPCLFYTPVSVLTKRHTCTNSTPVMIPSLVRICLVFHACLSSTATAHLFIYSPTLLPRTCTADLLEFCLQHVYYEPACFRCYTPVHEPAVLCIPVIPLISVVTYNYSTSVPVLPLVKHLCRMIWNFWYFKFQIFFFSFCVRIGSFIYCLWRT